MEIGQSMLKKTNNSNSLSDILADIRIENFTRLECNEENLSTHEFAVLSEFGKRRIKSLNHDNVFRVAAINDGNVFIGLQPWLQAKKFSAKSFDFIDTTETFSELELKAKFMAWKFNYFTNINVKTFLNFVKWGE